MFPSGAYYPGTVQRDEPTWIDPRAATSRDPVADPEASGVAAWIARGRRFLERELWTWEPEPRSAAAWARRPLQLAVMISEGFVRDQLTLRATALTYVTALALIPLLALALGIVDAVGVKENLARAIVEPLTVGNPTVRDYILETLASVRLQSLGTMGAATLLVTTLLTIGNIERALNHIWGVKEQRSYLRRFTDYLAVLVTAPLLLAVALSLRTTLQNQKALDYLLQFPLFDLLYASGLVFLPVLMYSAAFAFLFVFLPNTYVRLVSALIGGVVAGALFTGVQAVYATSQVGAARYDALFGAAAAFPLFVVFVYFSWSVILFGAEVAFAHQNLEHYRRDVRGTPPGAAAREALGLEIALEIARRFRSADPVWTADTLAERIDVPVRIVRSVLGGLEEAGLVMPCGRDPEAGAYQLGRPADRIRVADVLGALRGPRPAQVTNLPVGAAASRLLDRVEAHALEITGSQTLEGLLAAMEDSAAPGGQAG